MVTDVEVRDLSGVGDAVQLLEVLEHFPHAAGREILAVACGRLSAVGQFFVGTPAVWMEQGAAYGNEFERHRSLWTAEDLRGAGFEVLQAGEPDRFGNQMLLAVVHFGSPPVADRNLPTRR